MKKKPYLLNKPEQIFHIEVFNAQGSLIFEQTKTFQNTTLSKMKQGVYFEKIIVSDQ